METVNLVKGERVNLTKGTNVTRIKVGLGWSTQRYDGNAKFDLDVSTFLLSSDEKCKGANDIVFFNNPKDDSGAVVYGGDNKVGSTGTTDDEIVEINLRSVPTKYDSIDFTATIYEAEERKQTFGQVDKAYIRIVDLDTGKELIRYNLVEDFDKQTAVVVGKLYRDGSEWKFRAIGAGYNGGLKALVNSYGLKA